MPKQAEAKRDDVINPQNYNFNQILTRKIRMLSKRYESIEVDRRTSKGTAYVFRGSSNISVEGFGIPTSFNYPINWESAAVILNFPKLY